jgi:2-amino-4-hydroxy-6-hydroxymethyldihydropteridine diphosphokinase
VIEPRWRPAYIGIGSNLDSPAGQVSRGISALATIPKTKLMLQSNRYASAPMGPADQPDYVNAVAALLTQLEPIDLLSELQAIEIAHGRTRDGERWGARILDLDLLAFANVVLAESELTVPHPGIVERNFVLLPWAEIAPYYRVPGVGSISELARSIEPSESPLTKID